MEQGVRGMEVVFVDDCSSDGSVEIVREIIPEGASRGIVMRIVSTSENSGQAAARALGLSEARGQYVAQLDADDWVDPGFYANMLEHALSNDADIVLADEVQDFAKRSELRPAEDAPADGRDILRHWPKKSVGLYLHNKLVRRSLYADNNISTYPGLNMWDDNSLTVRLLYFARKVVAVHGPRYHYNRMNSNSITATYGTAQVEQMMEVARRLAEFFESKPDGADFSDTVAALKYHSKLPLVRGSYSGLHRFKSTFPESDYIARKLDPTPFSRLGRVRLKLVRNGLGALAVMMYAVANRFFKL